MEEDEEGMIYVTDGDTGITSEYSKFAWNIAWFSVFIVGIIVGILASYIW